MGSPPSSVGAAQLKVTDSVVESTLVGVYGDPGLTAAIAVKTRDGVLEPTTFVAITLKLYTSPVTKGVVPGSVVNESRASFN